VAKLTIFLSNSGNGKAVSRVDDVI